MSNAPGAAHALDVLELLARRGEPLPAATVARELGLPRSSTYHLLGVLRDRGYVSHLEGERRYGLGVAAYELGSAYQRQAPLQRIARGTLDRLVDATGHNAHLAVLHGRDVLYVIEQRAPQGPVLVSDVGVRLPATLTATGLAILASLSAGQIRALFPHADTLVQRDGNGPSTPSQLRSLLQAVRQRGYAVEDGHITSGLKSVAVAVLDHSDHPVASVAVTFRSEVVDDAAFTQIVHAVGHAADDLSTRLHRQPRTAGGAGSSPQPRAMGGR